MGKINYMKVVNLIYCWWLIELSYWFKVTFFAKNLTFFFHYYVSVRSVKFTLREVRFLCDVRFTKVISQSLIFVSYIPPKIFLLVYHRNSSTVYMACWTAVPGRYLYSIALIIMEITCADSVGNSYIQTL